MFAAMLCQFRREVHAVQERAEAIMALCTEQGLRSLLGQATLLRGWALVAQDQKEEWISQIPRSRGAWRALPGGGG
jgi:hypothetical protein